MSGRHLAGLLFVALVLGIVPGAQGQVPEVRVGPQLSLGDDTDVGLGGRVEVGIPATTVFLSGTFDLFFPGGGVDYWEINANAGYGFPLNTTDAVIPYVLGGINVAHVSFDAPLAASDTEIGLNLGGGGRFPLPQFDLFFELRFELDGGEQVVATGGILF